MDEEMNASKRRKIEDAVLQTLRSSDLESATASTVRSAAEQWLGYGLSASTDRRLVQHLIDSFLLSTGAGVLCTASFRTNDDDDGDDNNGESADQNIEQQQQSDVRGGSDAYYPSKIICKLSDNRMVAIFEQNKETMVAFRDFTIKDGNVIRKTGVNRGLSLTASEWSSFRNSFPSIQEAIVKMESHLRRKHDAVHPLNNLNRTPEGIAKQSEADLTNSVVELAVDRSLTEMDMSNSTSVVHHPIKRARTESEAETTTYLAAGFSAEQKNQTQSGISNPDSQNHVIARNQEASSDSREQNPAERNHIEADISKFVPPFPNQARLHDTFNAVRPERLIPIQTTRLDGRNYHSWRHQLEFFLNQLNIAYVLVEPCPSLSSNPEANFDEIVEVKATIKKWSDDDYLCCHNILNSLSHNLFQFYSQKSYSARELWEELKSTYGEDFGTRRSQINNYIHFQMVDGVSILEQVQELCKIADSIVASGIWLDENFHVSVIVSKLPPSWKDFRVRLMREEFLPLNMLMHRLQVEEEFRRKETDYKKGYIEPKLDFRVGMRKRGYKRVCYSCGKEGHTSTNCRDRKFDGREVNQ